MSAWTAVVWNMARSLDTWDKLDSLSAVVALLNEAKVSRAREDN